MERWIGYALLSMCFAGFTAVLAKAGLQGISSDLALGIRTIFVAVFVLLFCGWVVDPAERSAVTWQHVGWLALSGLITLAAGLLIALGWPGNSLWILGLLLVFDLIFQGFSLIFLGLALRQR